MQHITPTGFVYVIQAMGTNRIKIGFSVEPDKRIKELRTGSAQSLQILAKLPGTRETEKRLHRALAEYRQGGEWFEVPPFIGLRILQVAREETALPVQSKRKPPRKRRARKHPAPPPGYTIQPSNNGLNVLSRRQGEAKKYCGYINRHDTALLRAMSVEAQRAWIQAFIDARATKP